MGSEDNGGILYCFNKYGIAEPICLTNIVNVEIDTNDKSDGYLDKPFINLKSVTTDTLSFTVEVTNTHFLRRWLRSNRRWTRKKIQQKKRKIAKEKKYGLLYTET